MSEKFKPKAFVAFQGGGVHGLAHIGALKELEKEFQIIGTAGTSAGAIIAAFYSAGYSPDHISDIFENLEWTKYVKRRWLSVLWKRNGLYDISSFHTWLSNELARISNMDNRPKNINFEQLYTKKEIYLAIVAHELNTADPDKKLIVFDHEKTSNTSVSLAISASIAIPILFDPVLYKENSNKLNVLFDKVCKFVDGGLSLNFPGDILLEKAQNNDSFLIGLRFSKPTITETDLENCVSKKAIPTTRQILSDYLNKASSVNLREIKKYGKYIDIEMDASEFSFVDFKLKPENKKKLIKLGEYTAKSAIDEYKAKSVIGKGGTNTIKKHILKNTWTPYEIDWVDGSKMVILPIYPQNEKVLCIGKYPVTNAQYKKFVEETNHQKPNGQYFNRVIKEWEDGLDLWNNKDYNADKQPVVCVSYKDIKAYCNWLNNKAIKEDRNTNLPCLSLWLIAAFGDIFNDKFSEQLEKALYSKDFTNDNEEEFFELMKMLKKIDSDLLFNLQKEIQNYNNSDLPAKITENDERKNVNGISDIFGNIFEWCLNEKFFPNRSVGLIALKRHYENYEDKFIVCGGSFLDAIESTPIFADLSNTKQKDNMRHSDLGFRIAGKVDVNNLTHYGLSINQIKEMTDKLASCNNYGKFGLFSHFRW